MTPHIHELLTCLGQRRVTTLLLMTQHGMVGADVNVPLDACYLTDSVILLRYFEAYGEVRQAISVIKKRTGKHERTIREMRLDKGITVGEPVRDFQGVLTGFPKFLGRIAGSKDRDELQIDDCSGTGAGACPTSADAALSRTIITEAGLACHVCSDANSLARSLGDGAGAILLTEEVVASSDASALVQALDTRPLESNSTGTNFTILSKAAQIPALSLWGLIWTGALLVMAGAVVLRRRASLSS